MTDFLDILDGPKRPEVTFAPPTGRNTTKYGLAALADEVRNLQAVPIGSGRNDQLNRSAVKLGGLVAAGALTEDEVTHALGEADGGLDYKATRDTIRSGLTFGMQQARAIPDRSTTSTLDASDSQRSDDPFSDLFAGSPAINTTASLGPPGSLIAEFPEPISLMNGMTGPTSSSDPSQSADDATLATWVTDHLPIVDWFDLWTNRVDVEWIVSPLLPARRLIALYSPPKVGKSLLLLELAYCISRGVEVWGATPERPYRVLYVDFENDMQADILPRLQNMGADPTQLDRLDYLPLPSLAGLDSEKGSTELMAAVQVYGSEVVVIDTVSRAVDGEENENDTWLKFYRHTGLKLKQAGVAMVRLDHTGKDETKGQRGGSAKGGDVDAVWRMSKVTDDTFRLTCEMSRFPIPASDKLLTLHRRESPLRHEVDPRGSREAVIEAVILWADQNGVDMAAGYRQVLTAVKAAGIQVGQDRCTEALKLRRQRAGIVDSQDANSSNTDREHAENASSPSASEE